LADETLEQMKAEFVADASESVDKLAQRLADLDAAASYPRDLTDELFRRAHSLRGTAGMFGFDQVSTVAKSFENLLEAVRAGKIPVSAQVLRLFVEALDEISALLRTDDMPKACSAAETVIQKIDRALGESGTVTVARPPGAGATAPAVTSREQESLSVKVPIDVLDSIMNTLAELFSARLALASATKRLPRESATRRLADDLLKATLFLNKGLLELQASVVGARLVPVSMLLGRYTGEVRRLARLTGKEIDLVCEGEATLIDRALLDKLYDPLLHIIRNAVDHGIESAQERLEAGKPAAGRITLRATQEANHVRIDVSDDGQGLDMDAIERAAARDGLTTDPESLQDMVFKPGFTTKGGPSEISGRGVGLDAVRTQVEAIRGVVGASSERGRGAVFSIWVPLTVAISKGMLVEESGMPVAIPMRCVVEVMGFTDQVAGEAAATGKVIYEGAPVPVIGLAETLRGNRAAAPGSLVIMGIGSKRRALLVEKVGGEVEIVTRPLPEAMDVPVCVAGATELHDGRPALVVQPEEILRTDALIDHRHDPSVRNASRPGDHDPAIRPLRDPLKLVVFTRAGRPYGVPIESLEGVQPRANVTELEFSGEDWEGIFFAKGLCYGLLRPREARHDRRPGSFEILKFRTPERCALWADRVLGDVEISADKLEMPRREKGGILRTYAEFVWKGSRASLIDPAGRLTAALGGKRPLLPNATASG